MKAAQQPRAGGRNATLRTRASYTAGGRTGRCRLVARASAAAGDKYDYIIVGGGTSGCVLANRLTADGTKRVLVLEAGGNGGAWETTVPAALSKLFKHPTLDWNLFSTLQKQLEREVYLARGRTLGGSSSTNATLYLRGTAADYDAWGLEGWAGKDVLNWFINAEMNSRGASKYHGAGGVMKVESPRYENILHDAFFQSAAAAGLKANEDFNNWSTPQDGFGEFQVTQWNGRRMDAFQTYLKPALGRENLKVVTGARATQLHMLKSSGKPQAGGVEYAVGGPSGQRTTAELAPGGEVLLCSGTVANPQLLMLSGIGPAAKLSDAGVQVVVDAAGVGANLQDHPATLWAAKMKPEKDDVAITSEIYNDSSSLRLKPILQLLLQGKGPLATTGCDHGAFVNTRGGSGQPDLQIRFVPGYALDSDAIQSYVRFGELKAEGKKWPAGVTMQLLTARPRSRGSVGLKSTNPFDLPAVDINYFSDKDSADLATLVSGVKIAREIAAKSPLGDFLSKEGWPGASVQTEADLEAYARRTAVSGNALVGTCRMGAAPTDGSVVSSKDFSLWGVSGLRVVDASVIPNIPGGQTGAATVMLAERAAAALTGSSVAAPPGAKVAMA